METLEEAPNILVVGAGGAGKSALIRLLLGKYSIGESKDFFLHTGLMGHNNRLVRIIECPPRREESLEEYTEKMGRAVRQLPSPLTCVILVIKQNTVSGGGFQLNKERNIPLDELRAAYSIMGNKFKTSIHVVFSNWSRQFARHNERTQRGINEETAQNKVANEFHRNLGISKISCYFMDTVFWRNEQRNAEKGKMTTLQSSYSLAGAIFREPYDPVSDTSTPKVQHKVTSRKPPTGPLARPSSTPHYLNETLNFSDSSDSDSRLSQWKTKKYLNSREKSGLAKSEAKTVPVQLDDADSFPPPPPPLDGVVRAVPIQVIESSQDPSNISGSKEQINKFVEDTVKEMMKKEGVVLDFTEAKLKGKIITKTKIIKEIVNKNGEVEFVEEEELDESSFGPEYEDPANLSVQSESSSRLQRDIINSSKPIYNLGSPVVSSTFDRRRTVRSNGTQYEGFDSSSDSSSVDSLRPEDIESDANQVIEANHHSHLKDDARMTNGLRGGTTQEYEEYRREVTSMTRRTEDVRKEVTNMTRKREEVRSEVPVVIPITTNGARMSRSDSVSSSDLSQVIDEALLETNMNQNFVVVHDQTLPRLDTMESSVVVCGTRETITTMEGRLRDLGARRVVGCEVTAGGGHRQYESLLNSLNVGEQVIFIWAIETKTGDVDDDLISIFKTFLKIFAPESIKSMIVVLWYPGAMEDLRESIEDLTEAVRRNYQYNSPLGFPVLQYKPDTQFGESLTEAALKVQPFEITNIEMKTKREETEQETKTNLVRNKFAGEEIEIISSDHEQEEKQDEEEDVTVSDPVVLIVGPPGHGKSSIGNLILGGDHFQIRGNRVLEDDKNRTRQGYLQRGQAFATVIEAPGFYDDNLEEHSRRVVETELRKVGLLTHIIVAWHALDQTETDMDVVLREIIKYFGTAIVDKLIFAVTYCDSGSKAKKYRTKMGISFDSIAAMINEKVGQSFRTDEEPLIYFLCAKQPRDPSRKQLVGYLNSDHQWSSYRVSRMKPWTSEGITNQVEEKPEDNYEEVDEEVFLNDGREEAPSSSKSLSNLHHASEAGLARESQVSASTTALHQDRGRGRMFSTSSRRKLSSTNSNLQHKSAGRGKSQPNLFGGSRSRSRSRSNLSKTTSNLALSEETRSSGRPRGRSNMLRTKSGSRSRQNLAMERDKSEDNLYDERRRGGKPRGGQSNMFRSRSKSRGSLAKTRSNIALQESQANLSQPNLYEESPIRGGRDSDTSERRSRGQDEGTLERRPRGRMFSSGSTGSTAMRRGRSKSRDRLRQSRQNLRQTSTMPRSRSVPDEPGRPPIERSKSDWSLRSSNRRRQQRRSGDCAIL